MSYTTTVTGSYPRKEVQKDTLRKPSVSEEESFEMIKWAVKEQSDLGLDIITDGEGYRENMYWFYQLRLDGVDAINKIRKDFTLGGSMKGVDLSKTHGSKGFGIECAVVKDEIKNLKTFFHTEAGTVKAVNDVSFDIYKGEVLGIVTADVTPPESAALLKVLKFSLYS